MGSGPRGTRAARVSSLGTGAADRALELLPGHARAPAVDQFQEHHLVLQRWGAHCTPSSAGTKLYGGQGPVSSSSTPLSRYSAASSPASCSKHARSATR